VYSIASVTEAPPGVGVMRWNAVTSAPTAVDCQVKDRRRSPR
jgi:hypothetical protein